MSRAQPWVVACWMLVTRCALTGGVAAGPSLPAGDGPGVPAGAARRLGDAELHRRRRPVRQRRLRAAESGAAAGVRAAAGGPGVSRHGTAQAHCPGHGTAQAHRATGRFTLLLLEMCPFHTTQIFLAYLRNGQASRLTHLFSANHLDMFPKTRFRKTCFRTRSHRGDSRTR